MSSEPLRRLSPEEYLAFERGSETRHQFVDGEVFDMTGASERHNQVVANLVIEIGLQFRGRPCRVYANDMRVAVSAAGPFYYPDVVALCEEPRLLDDHFDTLLNPAVVIEVLSPTTEAFDRGPKFAHYRAMASLAEVVFVAQDAVRVEHFARQGDGHWLFTDLTSPAESVELANLGCRVELAQIYDKVDF